MKRNIVLIVLVLVIIVSCLILRFSQGKNNDAIFVSATQIEFTDSEGVTVILETSEDSSRVRFSGIGYIDLTLISTTSASGAKFYNSTEDVSIWNKEDELMAFKGSDLVYLGNKYNPKIDSVTEVEPEYKELSEYDVLDLIKNGTWEWIMTTDKNGNLLSPQKPEVFTVTFTADGMFRATTDCNDLSGSYTYEDDKLAITDIASTRMYCEASQAEHFESLLVGSSTVTFKDTESFNMINGSNQASFKKHLVPN